MKKTLFLELFYKKLLPIFTLFIIPNILYAGFFSFISDFFVKDAPVDIVSENVQNMTLLHGSLNPIFNPASGGGDIMIVGGSALLSETGPSGEDFGKSKPSSDQISLYVVREGDSLSQIAKMFNVSVNTIVWGNNLRGTTITPGQTLVIIPVSGVRHVVRSGDSLVKIAKEYKGDLNEIIQYNDISVDAALAVGMIIIVPDGEIVTPTVFSGARAVRATSYPSYSGYYIKPVNGVRSQDIHGYNAVDLAAPYGSPIVASASGVIIISRAAGWNGGYGTYVVISHNNGTQTLYSHMSADIVSVGDVVSQGQIIGYVGSTGRSTGAHLHFEVRGAKNPF